MITEDCTSLLRQTKLRQEPRLAWVCVLLSRSDLLCYYLDYSTGNTLRRVKHTTLFYAMSCISRFILTMQVAFSKLENKNT